MTGHTLAVLSPCPIFRVITQAYQLRKYLPRQVVSAVRWESAMAALFLAGPAASLPRVFECGPGKSLSAILGKVHGKAAKNCQYIPC